MTISSETRKAGPYVGNGVTTSFSFAFKVFEKAEVVVTTKVIATGAETTRVLDSDYSVTLNADQDANPGGSVSYPLSGSAMASTSTLTITSDVERVQETDLQNGGGWNPQTVENALDRGTILAQQIQEIVDRCIKFPVSDASLTSTLGDASLRASKYLTFDSSGNVMLSDGGATITISSAMTPVVQAATISAALTVLGFSAFGKTLIDGADAAAVLTTLGVSAYAQTLLDDANAAAARATLAITGAGGFENLTGSRASATTFSFSYDAATMHTSAGLPIRMTASGAMVLDITTAGPALNGRDQAGAFSANSIIHVYAITDGTNKKVIASTAGPSVGPTLTGLTGYTYWKYLMSLPLNASTQFDDAYVVGDKYVKKDDLQLVSTTTSGSEVSTSLSGLVPTIAKSMGLRYSTRGAPAGAGETGNTLDFRLASGTSFMPLKNTADGSATGSNEAGGFIEFPYVSGNLIIHNTQTNITGNTTSTVNLAFYRVPNGA